MRTQEQKRFRHKLQQSKQERQLPIYGNCLSCLWRGRRHARPASGAALASRPLTKPSACVRMPSSGGTQPKSFSNEKQVYAAIKTLYEANAEPALQALSELSAAYSDFDAARIPVPAQKQTEFSHTVLGDWVLLGGE